MSAYSALEPPLREILRVIIPLGEDWAVRFQIINDLKAIVGSVDSLRGATVETYGSFVSDLFTRWGDLDISIEIPNGSHILTAGRKHKQTLLADIQKVLRSRGGWRRFLLIANAKVPILKCESYLNISCDISINNLSGQMKSKILFWLKGIDGRFREMVLLVKEWAKAHGINDSKTGSFNSYCLSLLVIFHFQTCIPPIFPPLGEIYPGNMIDDLRGVRTVAERQIEDTCFENINKFNRLKNNNQIPLCELFVSFIAKFTNISSWAPTQGICLYSGQWENIENNMQWLPKTYALFVEDPFEQPANTARSVSSKQLVKISEAFQMTIQKLHSHNHMPASIVPFLVRPQIYQLLPRAMVYEPNIGYNIRALPQMSRPNHRPWQPTHQTRNHNNNNGKKAQVPKKANTQRPAQGSSQKQEQKIWIPRSNDKKV